MKENGGFFKYIFRMWFAGLLWLVTSIPVVTLGVSTTALIYTEMQIHRGTLRSTVQESFFRAFRDNIKNGTILLAVYAVLGGGLYAAANALGKASAGATSLTGTAILRIICLGLLIVVAFSAAFAFAVQARFTNTVKGTILYSCVMSTRNLLATIVILAVVWGLKILCVSFFPVVPIVLALIGAGFVFYGFAVLYCRAFLPYIPDEKRTEAEREYARLHHIPSGIENAAQAAPAESAESEAEPAEEDNAAETETDSAESETEEDGAAQPVQRINLSDAPTGVYPRGRKHSMADIIAATVNEADDEEEN